MSKKLQRTLVLLKIDAVHRALVGRIVQRFEDRGFKIIGLKMLMTDEDTAKQHYTEDLAKRRGEEVRRMMIEMLTSGPIIALALEGIDSIEAVRQMVGETQPLKAAPGTIRGDFAHQSYAYADAREIGVFNLIHASDAPETAKTELAVWFKPDELMDHRPDYTRLTLHEE